MIDEQSQRVDTTTHYTAHPSGNDDEGMSAVLNHTVDVMDILSRKRPGNFNAQYKSTFTKNVKNQMHPCIPVIYLQTCKQ